MSHFLRVPGVPDHARDLLAQLLREDLIPVPALANIVASYRSVIHAAHQRDGQANTEIGDQIADALTVILDSVTDATSAKSCAVIQAAVRYFVIQNDGEGHDLATPYGLNDDARVLNALCRFFGRDDLMIRNIPKTQPSTRPQVRSSARRR